MLLCLWSLPSFLDKYQHLCFVSGTLSLSSDLLLPHMHCAFFVLSYFSLIMSFFRFGTFSLLLAFSLYSPCKISFCCFFVILYFFFLFNFQVLLPIQDLFLEPQHKPEGSVRPSISSSPGLLRICSSVFFEIFRNYTYPELAKTLQNNRFFRKIPICSKMDEISQKWCFAFLKKFCHYVFPEII